MNVALSLVSIQAPHRPAKKLMTLTFLIIAAGITFYFRPRTFTSKFGKLPPNKEHFKRVVLLNIDGCRFDHFTSLDLPTARRLESEGTSVENGATTVYRALTNSAFANVALANVALANVA